MAVRLSLKVLASSALALSLALPGVQVHAATASPCKVLEQKACAGKTECSWIGATKRKDGKHVKAYCRLKSGKSAAAKK